MSSGDIAYVSGALLAMMGICSLPVFGSMRGAGPRQRAVLAWQLAAGWAGMAALVGWVALGWLAAESGGRWAGVYRDGTLVLTGAYLPLLVIAIRAGNRAAAAAREADLAPAA